MLGRIAMSLLTGTSLGASLMYLLDPEAGAAHRKQIRRKAEDLYDTAADSAAAGWETVRERAGPMTANLRGRLSDRLADASRAIAPTSRDYGLEYDEAEKMELSPTEAYTAMALSRHSRDLHGEAREAYGRARDMYYDALIDLDLARTRYRRQAPKEAKVVKEKVTSAAEPARSWGKKERKPDYLTISLVAAGCCAAGAAAMFILDPSAGRRRRALVRDKASGAVHRTTDAVSGAVGRATRQVRDFGQGKVAQAKTAIRSEGGVSDEKLVARVRSELGRVVSHPHHVEVRATNGSVMVSGTCLASEFDALMKCVYSVDGVREVINRIETQSTYGGDAPATGDLTAL